MEFDFDFDAAALLAQKLHRVSGETLNGVAAAAVNRVTGRFDDKQRKGQTQDLNLPRSYIDELTTTTEATAANPRATITTKGNLTVLDRYGARPYQRAGDTDKLGRRLGRRQAGVHLPIRPSQPQNEDALFMLPLKNNPGRKGVFVRTTASGGKPKHLYGPSPYALFRFQIKAGEEALQDDLETTAMADLAGAIEKALE